MSENKTFKEKFLAFYEKDSTKTLMSSLISILIGLLVGFIVMVLISVLDKNNSISSAFQGLRYMFLGPFGSKTTANVLSNTGNMIFYSVPLIFTGLSVAIAYKTGLFNIGAPGQFIMGTIGSLFVALSIQTTTAGGAVLVWLLALLTGTICGALWGLVPGLLKAFFDINEVILFIMTNWIAANLASWIFKYAYAIQSKENTKGGFLMKPILNHTPKLGLDKLFPNSMIDIGIFIAIIVAIIVSIILNKTTFGYELKACGANKNSAKYAGMNEKRNIILSIMIAGALSGMGAALYYLNPAIEYKFNSQYSSLPAYGFNGIASAFLANCNPIGTIFSSIFIRYLNMGGDKLNNVGFNRYVADIIIAVIIYMAGFSRIIKENLLRRSNNRKSKGANANAETKEPEPQITITEVKLNEPEEKPVEEVPAPDIEPDSSDEGKEDK